MAFIYLFCHQILPLAPLIWIIYALIRSGDSGYISFTKKKYLCFLINFNNFSKSVGSLEALE